MIFIGLHLNAQQEGVEEQEEEVVDHHGDIHSAPPRLTYNKKFMISYSTFRRNVVDPE